MRRETFPHRPTGRLSPDDLSSGPRFDELSGDSGGPWSRSSESETPHGAGSSGKGDPRAAHHPPGVVVPDRSNRRTGPRHHLVYRVARLADGDDEMLCIVRDISSGGLCVRIFGADELPARLDIVLANDHRFALAKAWQEGARGGFRFLEPIETTEFLNPENLFPAKRGLRLRTNDPVQVLDGRGRMTATLLDISVQGAKLRFADRMPPLGDAFDIRIPDLATKLAELRWMQRRTIGVKFREEIGFNALAGWSAARWSEKLAARTHDGQLLKRRA